MLRSPLLIVLISGCASYDKREVVDTRPSPTNPAAQAPALIADSKTGGLHVRLLKRKIAVSALQMRPKAARQASSGKSITGIKILTD